MVTKRSHILKQTCSFQVQVCLSMCDLFLPPGIKGLIIETFRMRFSLAINNFCISCVIDQTVVQTFYCLKNSCNKIKYWNVCWETIKYSRTKLTWYPCKSDSTARYLFLGTRWLIVWFYFCRFFVCDIRRV